jgi:hypothetical protein
MELLDLGHRRQSDEGTGERTYAPAARYAAGRERRLRGGAAVGRRRLRSRWLIAFHWGLGHGVRGGRGSLRPPSRPLQPDRCAADVPTVRVRVDDPVVAETGSADAAAEWAATAASGACKTGTRRRAPAAPRGRSRRARRPAGRAGTRRRSRPARSAPPCGRATRRRAVIDLGGSDGGCAAGICCTCRSTTARTSADLSVKQWCFATCSCPASVAEQKTMTWRPDRGRDQKSPRLRRCSRACRRCRWSSPGGTIARAACRARAPCP